MIRKLGKAAPNILVGGGATKIKPYLQFVRTNAKDLISKPKIICVFDHDDEGIKAYSGIDTNKYNQTMSVEKIYVNRSDGSFDEKLKFEFEDMLPLNILLDSVNAYLKKRGYRKIADTKLGNRYSAANNSRPILDIITELARSSNSSKISIEFNDTSVKLFINKDVCERITNLSTADFELILSANQGLKSFIDAIIIK